MKGVKDDFYDNFYGLPTKSAMAAFRLFLTSAKVFFIYRLLKLKEPLPIQSCTYINTSFFPDNSFECKKNENYPITVLKSKFLLTKQKSLVGTNF